VTIFKIDKKKKRKSSFFFLPLFFSFLFFTFLYFTFLFFLFYQPFFPFGPPKREKDKGELKVWLCRPSAEKQVHESKVGIHDLKN